MTGFDPLDGGTGADLRWTEFRLAFAAAYLTSWLLADLSLACPDYYEELKMRIGNAVSYGYMWQQDPPDFLGDHWDGEVPLSDPRDEGIWWIPLEVAEGYEEQLFPPGGSERDFLWASRGIAAVGLHASLDAYARALDIDLRGKPLWKAIALYLGARSPSRTLPFGTGDVLRELHETRVLFAHKRGIVDQQYIDRVANNSFVLGERRVVEDSDLRRYAKAVWQTALLLRG
jgi:hypothetical protein